MSRISSLSTPVRIVEPLYGKDPDGFQTVSERTIAEILCRMEVKNATERWSNRADLREASSIFTFRSIPGMTITTRMVLMHGDDRYDILSVEDIRGRGMYTQIVAKLQEEDAYGKGTFSAG